MSKLHEPVQGPSVWRRQDLENDKSWLLQLSDSQAGEISQAHDRVLARGMAAGEFGREDFDLPTLKFVLADVLEQLQHGRGIVVMRGLPIDPSQPSQASTILWGIGTYLGRGLRQSPHVNLGNIEDAMVGYIVDQGLDPHDINVHGSATSIEQRAHCDPSDLVALLCVRPAADGGGLSSVVSAMSVYNEILEQSPEAIEGLYRGFYHDLRRQGAASGLMTTPHPIPVYSYHEGHLSVNFNAKTIETGAARLNRPLPPDEKAALRTMEETTRRPDLSFEMMLQTGDLQLLNNYTVLHSRATWQDPKDQNARRFMMRLWLRTLAPRPLAPGFAGGFITGTTYDVAAQVGLAPVADSY